VNILPAGSIFYENIAFEGQTWMNMTPGNYYRIIAATDNSGNGNLRCKQVDSNVNNGYTVGLYDGSNNITIGTNQNPGDNIVSRANSVGKTFQIYQDKGGAAGNIQCGFGW
jgi:hypothetical protein